MIGTTIGPYTVLGKLGKGGMGEVYRARDAKLNRDVAIKVLPDLFAKDAERLARFTREAQTVASLNHPNIAQVYGLEGSALVMELVEGEDLSVLIARGALPVPEAMAIAKQIADGLEFAHEQGIVHRDLKPANIKVRPDGTVKVLDFGLAKALDAGQGSGSGSDHAGAPAAMNSPTLTAHATQMGMIIGTAAYMSPEQARGKSVDRRADIWAFGVVVYEMLTGRRAFEGDEISDVLAAVLRQDIDFGALPAATPASIRRLLRRCLEKDPRKRLSAIGDARLELDETEPSAAPATPLPMRAGVWPRLWPALVAVTLTAIAAAALWPRTSAAPGNLSRLSILAPPGDRIYPDSTSVAISPDGRMVAFIIGTVARADTELWVRALDSMVARRLDDASGAILPFWSPDSRRIGFFTGTKLKTIAVTGGRAETLADAPGGRGATWSPANVIVFAPDAGGPLFRIPAAGGTPEPVTTLDPERKEFGHRFPTFLPDGERFLYASLLGKAGKFDIFAGSLRDTSRTFIGSLEAAPVFADPGWLLYARQGLLAAVPFDPVALKITGDPITLPDEPASILDPATSFTAGRSVSVSSVGSLSYYTAPSVNTVAAWYDASGARVGTLNLPPGHYESASISPDGTRAVMVRSTSPSESALWLVDLSRGGASPLVAGAGRNDTPVWSPDGTRVVFAADREGPQNLFVKVVNDGSPEQRLFASDVPFKGPGAWSPDGAWIVMVQLDAETSQNIWLLPASGDKPPTQLVAGRLRDLPGPVSPNGRWLVYVADDSGRYEAYVQPFPAGGRRVQISERGALGAWWTHDGRQLILVDHEYRSVWRVDVTGSGDAFEAGPPRQIAMLPPGIMSMAAMPDRQRFLVIEPERTSEGAVTIVQNWRAGLPSTR